MNTDGLRRIQLALYALPEELSPDRGFDPAALREEALATLSSAGLMTLFYGRQGAARWKSLLQQT